MGNGCDDVGKWLLLMYVYLRLILKSYIANGFFWKLDARWITIFYKMKGSLYFHSNCQDFFFFPNWSVNRALLLLYA